MSDERVEGGPASVEVLSESWSVRGDQKEGLQVYRDHERGTDGVLVTLYLEGWRIRMELAVQGGRLVVSELHLDPEDSGQRARGIRAQVPRAGITARLLRRVPLHDHVDKILKALRSRDDREFYETLLMATGASELLRTIRPPAEPTNRRGRPRVAVDLLLRAAAAYAKAVSRGSAEPVMDGARALRIEPERLRDLVHRARERGLLTPTRQGHGGGELTPHALTLLAKKKRKGGAK